MDKQMFKSLEFNDIKNKASYFSNTCKDLLIQPNEMSPN